MYNSGKIGLLGSHLPDEQTGDYEMFIWSGLPYIHVMYNNEVYRVAYPTVKWDIINLGTW